MMSIQPFNITISVPSGNPDKLRVIEKTNRLSLGLVFNRDELAEVSRTRVELSHTGVYILVRTDNTSLPEIYIGEGESVIKRLRSHNKDDKKEFWEWCVVFVNKDNSLHKAHIQYLESCLVNQAISNKRCQVKNDVLPKQPTLSDSVLFEAADLLNDIYQILPLLGITAFESTVSNLDLQSSDLFMIKSKGISAHAIQTNGKILVKENSQGVLKVTPLLSNGVNNLRTVLLEQGVLDEREDHLIFTQDYTFDSPSTAAAIILGRNANGRIEWKLANGTSLKQLQEDSMN